MSRPVRSWEFLPAVGTRAGLFGNEAGRFEAWVYPLKLFRNFRLVFHTDGRELPAESLARTVTVHPESCSIVYAGDTFQVREMLFVPLKEPGAIITLEIETALPLEVEVAFQRDFQLEWPAALGGTYLNWELPLRAFYFGEEQKKYAALVGSPTAVLHSEEYETNYSSSEESSFLLGPTLKGKETKLVVIAASMQGLADAQRIYEGLISNYGTLLRDSADYYRKYLDQTVQLELPDAQLQQAYDWARVSMVQGLVTSPYLGAGLIAGYRTSGSSQRPGFAWFFGRDALWTSLALDADGDFATTRTALDFLSQYQRADGKIAHEISQGANFVPWFKDYLYAYASADATPLYIIAMNDYAMHSGDVNFVKEKWDSLWKAYQFLKSTYDTQNLPQNFGIGHGWVEGGPLLPVKTEFYQSGLGAEALHALGNLAHLTGKEDVSKELEQAFASQKTFLNQAFWSPEKNLFSFALDRNNQRVDMPSVLATVPMWFGLLDEAKSEATLNLLADSDHQTDWGMRIISSRDPKYNPGGYHFGSVWPLFTGWASVGEYRYHRALPAYSNLRANALLASDGSLGHVTEVLSGNYYQPLSTSSPHQIWSAAMVVSPILRGMLGLDADAFTHEVVFAPHTPYGWNWVHLSNLRLENCTLDLTYRRTADSIVLEAKRNGTGSCTLEFSPALSLRASVSGTEINGRPVPVHIEKNSVDQHATVRFPVSSGPNTLHMRVHNDFGLSFAPGLPALGSSSEGLRVVSETWSPRMDALTLDVAGRPGHTYELGVWNPEQVSSVDGAVFEKADAKVRIQFSGTGEDYVHSKVVFHFAGKHGF
ncbi:MAG TPA: amylo-alpha-1,6-glucosidase [Terriglobales bacterium]|nr:amylo-alpha-1,6-glucosidase [Terriglobales bacterium]